MASNTNIQIAELDFNNIKSNFITFLKSQSVLKDYDYSGSALSVLLDVLAMNTQYNGFYLNMIANEMFLDSAIQRSSVVSLAKALNYVPKICYCSYCNDKHERFWCSQYRGNVTKKHHIHVRIHQRNQLHFSDGQ